jgi:transcriptional regulator with XRE-family HTH domain
MKLREFLFFTKKSQEQARKELGLSRGHMNGLVRGVTYPRKDLAQKIYIWSKGAVTPLDFLDKEWCQEIMIAHADHDEGETFKINHEWFDKN